MHNVIYGYLVNLHQQQPGGGAARHAPSLTEIVVQASLPIKMVLLLLAVFSVICWYIIGYKWLYLRRAFAENESFLQVFEETRQLNVAAEAAALRTRSPVAQMYRAGYDELLRVKAAAGGEDTSGIENIERALRRATSRQTTILESMVPFLATTGSTAPFIGLFGTVYGIMHAFLQLTGSQGTSTIDRVGPGIAEALFTTAVGLVAAIPAVIAYNYFNRQIRVISNEMEGFGNDFLNIVRRHILK